MVAGIDRASSKLHKQLLGNDRAQHPAGTVRPRVRPASRIRLDYRGGRFFPYIWTPLIKRRARGTNRTRYVKWLNVTHETESSRPIRFYQMRFKLYPIFFNILLRIDLISTPSVCFDCDCPPPATTDRKTAEIITRVGGDW